MSTFAYLIAEGVLDVAFLGKLLRVQSQAVRVRRLDDLDEVRQSWVRSFKWPYGQQGQQIDRLAVPAPVFYRIAPDLLVGLRNAEGITRIGTTIEDDLDLLSRRSGAPDAIGVILDSDDEPADQRFDGLKVSLEKINLGMPRSLGEVSVGSPRVGVFAFPEPGTPGTLEDILLPLGGAAYPELAAAAQAYADGWRQKAQAESATSDWKELRKPAGAKKATIGAMTAILKPGKATQVSLEDNRWVSEETKTLARLQPCLAFLNKLLAGLGLAAADAPLNT